MARVLPSFDGQIRGEGMTRRALLATSSVLALALGASAAFAADVVRPVYLGSGLAVSQTNGKIGAFGGSIDGDTGYGLLGAISIPLQQQWGAQVDGMFGTAGSAPFWGLGGHLFWRDPRQGLVGVYASSVDWSGAGAHVNKFGVEGEWYQGQWTLSGMLAAQSGTFTGWAGSLTGAIYVQENFRLDATYRFLEGLGGIVTVGGEWQHDNSGFSLFGSGSWAADGGHSTVIGGLKFYGAPPKSLMRRHREDDPEVTLPLDLFHTPPSTSCQLLEVTVAAVCIDGCCGPA
jgi:hypothetical protein